jgi:alkylation response protein AidB-like acyl-CoA dehydrogenase
MPILLYGNEEQKNKYIPKLASGEHFGMIWLGSVENSTSKFLA